MPSYKSLLSRLGKIKLLFLPKPFLDGLGNESNSLELEALSRRVRLEMDLSLEGKDKEPGKNITKSIINNDYNEIGYIDSLLLVGSLGLGLVRPSSYRSSSSAASSASLDTSSMVKAGAWDANSLREPWKLIRNVWDSLRLSLDRPLRRGGGAPVEEETSPSGSEDKAVTVRGSSSGDGEMATSGEGEGTGAAAGAAGSGIITAGRPAVVRSRDSSPASALLCPASPLPFRDTFGALSTTLHSWRNAGQRAFSFLEVSWRHFSLLSSDVTLFFEFAVRLFYFCTDFLNFLFSANKFHLFLSWSRSFFTNPAFTSLTYFHKKFLPLFLILSFFLSFTWAELLFLLARLYVAPGEEVISDLTHSPCQAGSFLLLFFHLSMEEVEQEGEGGEVRSFFTFFSPPPSFPHEVTQVQGCPIIFSGGPDFFTEVFRGPKVAK